MVSVGQKIESTETLGVLPDAMLRALIAPQSPQSSPAEVSRYIAQPIPVQVAKRPVPIKPAQSQPIEASPAIDQIVMTLWKLPTLMVPVSSLSESAIPGAVRSALGEDAKIKITLHTPVEIQVGSNTQRLIDNKTLYLPSNGEFIKFTPPLTIEDIEFDAPNAVYGTDWLAGKIAGWWVDTHVTGIVIDRDQAYLEGKAPGIAADGNLASLLKATLPALFDSEGKLRREIPLAELNTPSGPSPIIKEYLDPQSPDEVRLDIAFKIAPWSKHIVLGPQRSIDVFLGGTPTLSVDAFLLQGTLNMVLPLNQAGMHQVVGHRPSESALQQANIQIDYHNGPDHHVIRPAPGTAFRFQNWGLNYFSTLSDWFRPFGKTLPFDNSVLTSDIVADDDQPVGLPANELGLNGKPGFRLEGALYMTSTEPITASSSKGIATKGKKPHHTSGDKITYWKAPLVSGYAGCFAVHGIDQGRLEMGEERSVPYIHVDARQIAALVPQHLRLTDRGDDPILLKMVDLIGPYQPFNLEGARAEATRSMTEFIKLYPHTDRVIETQPVQIEKIPELEPILAPDAKFTPTERFKRIVALRTDPYSFQDKMAKELWVLYNGDPMFFEDNKGLDDLLGYFVNALLAEQTRLVTIDGTFTAALGGGRTSEPIPDPNDLETYKAYMVRNKIAPANDPEENKRRVAANFAEGVAQMARADEAAIQEIRKLRPPLNKYEGFSYVKRRLFLAENPQFRREMAFIGNQSLSEPLLDPQLRQLQLTPNIYFNTHITFRDIKRRLFVRKAEIREKYPIVNGSRSRDYFILEPDISNPNLVSFSGSGCEQSPDPFCGKSQTLRVTTLAPDPEHGNPPVRVDTSFDGSLLPVSDRVDAQGHPKVSILGSITGWNLDSDGHINMRQDMDMIEEILTDIIHEVGAQEVAADILEIYHQLGSELQETFKNKLLDFLNITHSILSTSGLVPPKGKTGSMTEAGLEEGKVPTHIVDLLVFMMICQEMAFLSPESFFKIDKTFIAALDIRVAGFLPLFSLISDTKQSAIAFNKVVRGEESRPTEQGKDSEQTNPLYIKRLYLNFRTQKLSLDIEAPYLKVQYGDMIGELSNTQFSFIQDLAREKTYSIRFTHTDDAHLQFGTTTKQHFIAKNLKFEAETFAAPSSGKDAGDSNAFLAGLQAAMHRVHVDSFTYTDVETAFQIALKKCDLGNATMDLSRFLQEGEIHLTGEQVHLPLADVSLGSAVPFAFKLRQFNLDVQQADVRIGHQRFEIESKARNGIRVDAHGVLNYRSDYSIRALNARTEEEHRSLWGAVDIDDVDLSAKATHILFHADPHYFSGNAAESAGLRGVFIDGGPMSITLNGKKPSIVAADLPLFEMIPAVFDGIGFPPQAEPLRSYLRKAMPEGFPKLGGPAVFTCTRVHSEVDKDGRTRQLILDHPTLALGSKRQSQQSHAVFSLQRLQVDTTAQGPRFTIDGIPFFDVESGDPGRKYKFNLKSEIP